MMFVLLELEETGPASPFLRTSPITVPAAIKTIREKIIISKILFSVTLFCDISIHLHQFLEAIIKGAERAANLPVVLAVI